MKTYHKIQTVFNRDPDTNYKRLVPGQWSKPEFALLADATWIVDEKIDGTNMRVLWSGLNVEFRGKTDEAVPIKDLHANMAKLFTPEKMTSEFGCISPLISPEELQVCLYGEGFGPGIQKGGGNYGKEKDFILFDVKIGNTWLERENVEAIAIALGIKVVPIVGLMTLHEMVKLVRDGFKSQFGDFTAEGVVARPAVQLFNRRGERVITKLKCKDFDELSS